MSLTDHRTVVVRPRAFGGDVVGELAARYPDRHVFGFDSFLSAIADVGRRGCGAILACVDAAEPRMAEALTGLRRAAGDEARIVLCCRPQDEPIARRSLGAGADEYVLHPLHGPDIDAALGLSPRITWQGGRIVSASPAAATIDELEHLGRLLSHLGRRPRALLNELAGIVKLALGAGGVTLYIRERSGHAGEPVASPVLTCPVGTDAGTVGRFDVGSRSGSPYTPGDVEKLEHYARLAAHLLRAAGRQRRWKRLAEVDDLTGLPNRRAFFRALAPILRRARRDHFPVTLLVFDLDDFKSYNDAYGHDVGDEVLRTAARLFRKHSREQDLLARLGGDEFAVVFHDAEGPRVAGSKHPESVLGVLERLREALRQQRFAPLGGGGPGLLTISGGLAAFPWDGAQADTLLHRADQALLEAKRCGKNRIVLVGDPGAATTPQP